MWIDENDLTGPIPTELGSLTSLEGKFNGKDRVDDASLLHIAVSVLVCNTFILDVSPSYPRHDHHLIYFAFPSQTWT